jgi:hypothetical protein
MIDITYIYFTRIDDTKSFVNVVDKYLNAAVFVYSNKQAQVFIDKLNSGVNGRIALISTNNEIDVVLDYQKPLFYDVYGSGMKRFIRRLGNAQVSYI